MFNPHPNQLPHFPLSVHIYVRGTSLCDYCLILKVTSNGYDIYSLVRNVKKNIGKWDENSSYFGCSLDKKLPQHILVVYCSLKFSLPSVDAFWAM